MQGVFSTVNPRKLLGDPERGKPSPKIRVGPYPCEGWGRLRIEGAQLPHHPELKREGPGEAGPGASGPAAHHVALVGEVLEPAIDGPHRCQIPGGIRVEEVCP